MRGSYYYLHSIHNIIMSYSQAGIYKSEIEGRVTFFSEKHTIIFLAHSMRHLQILWVTNSSLRRIIVFKHNYNRIADADISIAKRDCIR